MTADFEIEDHGSVWLVRPLTKACHTWLTEHTDAQWLGNALGVEARYIQALVASMQEEGFTLGG
jgi:hypothetical protein